MVSVDVPAEMPVMLTELAAPKLIVGRCVAPEGEEVTAALRATVPVNPPPGVIVIVEVLPCVAPALNVTDVPEMLKLDAIAEVTVIEAVPLLPEYDEAPDESGV